MSREDSKRRVLPIASYALSATTRLGVVVYRSHQSHVLVVLMSRVVSVLEPLCSVACKVFLTHSVTVTFAISSKRPSIFFL